jgi:Ser/Thr protein kinase RdoA (MazF antagonist)
LTASAWESLSLRAQLRRLRQLGRTALTSFGVQDAGLTLLRHEANTTFRVETAARRFLLTLWELEERPRYCELRDALLDAYAERRRALPHDHTTHLEALFVLRRMQMLMWALESRRHPAFRDSWQAWARDELDAIAAVA